MIHPFSFWKTSAAAHPGQALFDVWEAGIDAAGGTYTGSSKTIALNLADAIASASYVGKIRYLLPFLGADLTAARMPLVDSPTAGIATNNGFVGGDFSEATGLQDNGTKTLNTNFTAAVLGASGSGGLGVGIRTFGTGTWTIGSRNAGSAQIYGLAIYADELMYWGDGATAFSSLAAGGAKHYYGQRAATNDRKLYANATQIASATAVGSVSGIGTFTIYVGGIDTGNMCNHQLSFAYGTTGDMSGAEITAFDTLLTTYLITPTGR